MSVIQKIPINTAVGLADHTEWLSGWLHHFVCPDCLSMLEFRDDALEFRKDLFICPHCGKTVSGEKYQQAWVYLYRQKHAEQIIEAAARKEDPSALQKLICFIDLYADHYQEFPEHGTKSNKGKIMAQTLDEAVFGIHLLRAVYYVSDRIPEAKLQHWYRCLFLPMADFLLPQEDRIHNISVWVHCFAGMAGTVFHDAELLAKALEGEYGLFRQMEEGLTPDGLWREGSLHYHYYALEGLTYFCEVNDSPELLEILLKMYKAPLSLSFDGFRLPSLNDGWYPLDLCSYERQIAIAAKYTGDNDLQEQLTRILSVHPGLLQEPGIAVVQNRRDDTPVIVKEDHQFSFDKRVTLLREPIPMLLKSGSQVAAHAHRDALSIVIDRFSDDLGTPAYGSPLIAEWYKNSLSHNTFSIDGSQPANLLQNGVRKNEVGYEAWLSDPSGEILSATRTLTVRGAILYDSLHIFTLHDHCLEWAFHSEGAIWLSMPTIDSSLRGERYRFFEGVKRVVGEGELQIAVFRDESAIKLSIPLKAGIEVYTAQTPGNPADQRRRTILLRTYGTEAVFDVCWQLLDEKERSRLMMDMKKEPIIPDIDRDELPLVSVIVPIRNAEKTLQNCLESICLQTYRNIEILCIDGGSKDDSLSILEKERKKDPRISSQSYSCASMGEACNIGLKKAAGEYILFVNGDDQIQETLVEKAVVQAEKTNADLVCFPAYRYDPLTKKPRSNEIYLSKGALPKDRTVFSAAEISEKVFQLTSPLAICRLYRNSYLRENGLQMSGCPCFDDLAFSCLSMAKAERISFLTDALYAHSQRPGRTLQRGTYASCFFVEADRVYGQLSEEMKDSLCRFIVGQLFQMLRASIDPEHRISFLQGISEYQWLSDFLQKEDLSTAIKAQAECLQGAVAGLQEKKPASGETVLIKKADLSEEPSITVIMPVYQVEDYLEEALQSVLTQSLRAIEVICVDDGSTDRSLEILLELAEKDPRISVFSQEHAGISVARNTAIAFAFGKYLYFMDSDDLLKEDALTKMLQKAEEDQLDLLIFNAEMFYDTACSESDLSFIPQYQRREEYPEVCSGKELFDKLSRNNEYYVPVWLYLSRRSLIVEENIAFLPGVLYEDTSFTYELFMRSRRSAYLNDALYNRRIRPGSIMTSKRTLRNTFSCYLLYIQMRSFHEKFRTQMTASQAFSSFRRISVMLGNARTYFSELSTYEKGKALALGEEYYDYRTLVIDPNEFQELKTSNEERNRKTSAELSTLKDKEKQDHLYLLDQEKELKKLRKDLTEAEKREKSLLDEQMKLEDALQKADAEKKSVSERLRTASSEKAELNTKLQQTYSEKSELNAKLKQTYTEKSELNAKLQQTYAEKSDISAKLKQAYADKTERGQRIKELEKELEEIKSSRMYKVWKKMHS